MNENQSQSSRKYRVVDRTSHLYGRIGEDLPFMTHDDDYTHGFMPNQIEEI